MTLFDLLALGVIALSTLVSLMRGLVAEIASLFTLIAAFFIARTFSSAFAEAAFADGLLPRQLEWGLSLVLEPRQLEGIVSFMLLMLASWVVLKLFVSLLQSGVTALGLGWFNRLLGAVFGAARGVLIVMVAVLVCAFTTLPKTPAWQNALTAPLFEQLVKKSLPLLPFISADKVHYHRD